LSIWAVDRAVESEWWFVIAPTDRIEDAEKTLRERLLPFGDPPSRSSMDLPFASEIVRAHGGELLALPEGMPGAVVILPKATE
jgi:hypothetical protein